MRRLLIAGNWKMNCGPRETAELLRGIKELCPDVPERVDILVCPPVISLSTASGELENSDILLGAQNVYFEDNGAFTGEVSTRMLKEVGCEYVIIGHSERREYFGETDKKVNAKVLKALADGIHPIICVGESLDQRKKKVHKQMVKKQVESALNKVKSSDITGMVIAYEPIWAIGTGVTATPEQAQEMHEIIRQVIAELYDHDSANAVRILYGGSMKPHNADELLKQPDVDGGLIGGASLKAESFTEIIDIAGRLSK